MTFHHPLRALLLFLPAAMWFSVLSGPALAHVSLVSSVPPAEEAAGTETTPATIPLTELRLSFSEPIELAFSKVTVTDNASKVLELGPLALDPKDSRVLVVSLKSAPPVGEYTVEWTVVASDGHKISDSYKINVTQ